MSKEGMLIDMTDDLRDTCVKYIRETLHLSDDKSLSIIEMGLFKTKWNNYTIRCKLRIDGQGETTPWFNFKMVLRPEVIE